MTQTAAQRPIAACRGARLSATECYGVSASRYGNALDVGMGHIIVRSQ